MRPVAFPSSVLAATLRDLRVASLADLVKALGGPSTRTVFRKLDELDTLSSYSHRGKYYTLRSQARFDALGLWTHQNVRFSMHGTLRATAAALTAAAPRGWQARELDELLGVATHSVLRDLVAAGQLARVKRDGCFLYCATDPATQRRQLAARRAARPLLWLVPALRLARLATAVLRVVSLLDERQRRAVAGLAALLYGRGGDHCAAAWVGLHPKTVAKGRRELAGGRLLHGRVRRPGGGRKALVKKTLQ